MAHMWHHAVYLDKHFLCSLWFLQMFDQLLIIQQEYINSTIISFYSIQTICSNTQSNDMLMSTMTARGYASTMHNLNSCQLCFICTFESKFLPKYSPTCFYEFRWTTYKLFLSFLNIETSIFTTVKSVSLEQSFEDAAEIPTAAASAETPAPHPQLWPFPEPSRYHTAFCWEGNNFPHYLISTFHPLDFQCLWCDHSDSWQGIGEFPQ